MAYNKLSTANLPDPVIDPAQGSSPEDYFDTVTYSPSSKPFSITDLEFSPDFVWIKRRNGANDHNLFDSVRGATNKLESNNTNSEATGGLTSFDSNGWTDNGDYGDTGASGETYVAWNWKAGTIFSNDASATSIGTVDSNGSVNTTSGFSIVRFNSGASGTQSFKHGLTQRPDLCIFKEKDSGGSGDHWVVWEGVALNAAQSYGYLNLTNAFGNDASQWSNTAPTDSIFTYNSGYAWSTSQEMIAYCFHSVEGFSKCSSYVGNGSADGPFVYTGFRPAFVMVKRSSATGSWVVSDSERNTYNVANLFLNPDTSGAETTGSSSGWLCDFTSNGFKVRGSGAGVNGSGSTIIYMAFAENPFKYSNAR